MALQPAVLDIALSNLSQVPSDTMGPLGRLKSLINAQVKRFQPHYQGATGVVPTKIRVEPRDAFNSLPSTSRTVVSGDRAAPAWNQQRLLAELDKQLVSICGGSLPRVFDGSNWRTYPNNAVLTQKLAQEVLHTSQRTIQAPDSAWMNGVTCAVWTESTPILTGAATSTYVGFKADNGAWLVQPSVIGTSGGLARQTMARVVSDGAHFWVVFNDGNSTPGLIVYVFDVNGAFLAGTAATLPAGSGYPGFWDIVAAVTAGGYTMKLAVPAAIGQNNDLGVTFHGYGWNGTGIIHTSSTDAGVHCTGPVSWLTNDTGNGLAYLATGRGFSDSDMDIWAYEITNLAHTHEYSTGFIFITLGVNNLDSLVGNSFIDGSGVGVVVSIGMLPSIHSPAAHGPAVDPAFRFIKSIQVTRAAVATTLRTTQSVCHNSRAFAVDGNYYVIGYYQSGSGNILIQTKESVSITAGDYMIGAATQPLTVVAGDLARGSPILATETTSIAFGSSIFVSGAKASTSILSTDTVIPVSSSGNATYGIPDGTRLLLWTLGNLGASANTYVGSLLTVSGTPAALNGTFDILGSLSSGAGTNQFYTLQQTRPGNPVGGQTFASGTFTVTSMTCYLTSDLSPQITADPIARLYIGGLIAVTGASTGGDNGTFVIQRIRSSLGSATSQGSMPTGTNPIYAFLGSGLTGSEVWVLTAGQTIGVYPQGFKATVSPPAPNSWSFASGVFDPTYVGANLVVVSDPALPANAGTYPITAVSSPTLLVTGDATAILPQIFGFPFPTIQIDLTTQIPYTFKLQSITPDYTYQNAIVLVQGAADSVNNGTYKITQINADGTFIALPTNGLSNQVNEQFTGSQTITIFFAPNNEPAFQSTWFVVPLTGNQPVAGRFEYGLAYADWRIEADETAGPNLFPGALSSVAVIATGAQFVLPYRAENVTSTVTQITAAGQVDIGDATFSSTVGLKQFWLGSASGQAYSNSGELLLPGPMAGVFTASGFFEDNVNVAPEAPFLVSQSVAGAGQLGLTLGSVRVYVAVFEQSDENGNRIYSPPSPPLVVNMSGTNNVATIGGRLAFPLGSAGQPVAGTFGPTCRNVTISLYATAFINGVPTTQRYKITSDLNVNGIAPVSATNPSGFSFPDSFTWNFIDQNPDSEISGNEVLYVDKGYLPRYPAPAFSAGVGSWHNREWVIGYDGAIWMSGEKTEGDAIWFNPAFRYVLPTDDEPIGIAAMEDYLIVTCAQSIWYIPTAQFPDATGQNGGLPTPVRLPFQNGSIAGFAQTIREGVAYDSTAGGLWLITRNLDNVWLSHDVIDTLATPIVGLALDKAQRLFVLQQSGPIMVYDGIPAAWYEWQAPTTGVLLSTYGSQACYQDGATVNVVTPGQAADLVAGVTYGIAPDVTLAPLAPANVRGLKRIWEFQIVGTWLGPHRLNVILSYPEDGVPDTVYAPFTPLSSNPYILPFNPLLEEATLYGIRIFADFVGLGTPGLTFAFEMISAQVGLDSGVGLKKLPQGVTLVAAT